jgi:hypothetical protein
MDATAVVINKSLGFDMVLPRRISNNVAMARNYILSLLDYKLKHYLKHCEHLIRVGIGVGIGVCVCIGVCIGICICTGVARGV